jgi:hypothetical protein
LLIFRIIIEVIPVLKNVKYYIEFDEVEGKIFFNCLELEILRKFYKKYDDIVKDIEFNTKTKIYG